MPTSDLKNVTLPEMKNTVNLKTFKCIQFYDAELKSHHIKTTISRTVLGLRHTLNQTQKLIDSECSAPSPNLLDSKWILFVITGLFSRKVISSAQLVHQCKHKQRYNLHSSWVIPASRYSMGAQIFCIFFSNMQRKEDKLDRSYRRSQSQLVKHQFILPAILWPCPDNITP